MNFVTDCMFVEFQKLKEFAGNMLHFRRRKPLISSGDVTNTRNGERGTGNGEPGTGVWE